MLFVGLDEHQKLSLVQLRMPKWHCNDVALRGLFHSWQSYGVIHLTLIPIFREQTIYRSHRSSWSNVGKNRAVFLVTAPIIRYSSSHVKGHQDTSKTPFASLPLTAQLNIEADELAGSYRRRHENAVHSRAPLLSHT
eukprot:scaffold9605_cov93-Cylindrotheca_fusiformis.AAC.1